MISCFIERLLERMKWHKRPPTKEGIYLVRTQDGRMRYMEWCGGWNCKRDPVTGEIYKLHQRFDVKEWTEVDNG